MITYRINDIFNITISQWDAHNDNDLYVFMRTVFIFLFFYMYMWYYITLLLYIMLLSYFVRNDEIKMFNQSIIVLCLYKQLLSRAFLWWLPPVSSNDVTDWSYMSVFLIVLIKMYSIVLKYQALALNQMKCVPGTWQYKKLSIKFRKSTGKT